MTLKKPLAAFFALAVAGLAGAALYRKRAKPPEIKPAKTAVPDEPAPCGPPPQPALLPPKEKPPEPGFDKQVKSAADPFSTVPSKPADPFAR